MKNYATIIVAVVFLFTWQSVDVEALDNREQDRKINIANETVNEKEYKHNQNLDNLRKNQQEFDLQTKKTEEVFTQKNEVSVSISGRIAKVKEYKRKLKSLITDAYVKGEASELDVIFNAIDKGDGFGLTIINYVRDVFWDLISTLNQETDKLREEFGQLEEKGNELTLAIEKLRNTQEEYEKLCKESGQDLDKAKLARASLLDERIRRQKIMEEASKIVEKSNSNKSQNPTNSSNNLNNSKSSNITEVNSSTGWCWPLPSSYLITSRFGPRNTKIEGASKYHEAIDIGAPAGEKIIAAADGVVTSTGEGGAKGICCTIKHNGGKSTVYAHMSKRYAVSGQPVKKGDVIGLVGSTGVSSGNHLHFEYRINGSSVDPLKLFPNIRVSYYGC